MGTAISLSAEAFWEPTVQPVRDRPPTFDPMAGFDKGRKPREMKASLEDMQRAKLKAYEMDFCAHKLLEWKACQTQKKPLAAWFCNPLEHSYNECEFHDQILRMKEWEREHRLLKRMKRKREAAEHTESLAAANTA